MTNIEKITSRIIGEAQAEAARISEQAQKEVIRLDLENDEKIKSTVTDILSRARKNAENILERGQSAADMETAKYTLSEKQRIISEVFDKTAEHLSRLPKEEYIETVSKIAAKASETGSEELVMSERDKIAVGDEVVSAANVLLSAQGRKAGLTLSNETRPIIGGVILKNGRIEINCAFDVLVSGKRDELIGDVAAMLFDSRED